MRSKKTKASKDYLYKMARLLFYILLIFVIYYILRFFIKSLTSPRRQRETENEPETLVQDPYCQTYIPKGLALKKKIGGQVFYFCCEKCLKSYIRGRPRNSI